MRRLCELLANSTSYGAFADLETAKAAAEMLVPAVVIIWIAPEEYAKTGVPVTDAHLVIGTITEAPAAE